MTLQELQDRALKLPIGDRWRLVQSLLSSIQSETIAPDTKNIEANSLTNLNPWTQRLVGVIKLGVEDPNAYVDYLEDKYS